MLLVASDSPYPEPLHSTRPLPDHFGVAMLLTPHPSGTSLASLSIELTPLPGAPSHCEDASLDALRSAIPAAAALPLLQALARGVAAQRVVLEYLPFTGLQVDVHPVVQPALVDLA
jgi:hypothetical protein